MSDKELSLKDVLVVTTKKSFWASAESSIFPQIIFSSILGGRSDNFHNALILFVRSLIRIVFKKPRLILVGSAPRLNAWFAVLKKWGALKNTRLAAIGHLEFGYYLVPYFDRIFVYSRKERDVREEKSGISGVFVYLPLPASNVDTFGLSDTPGNYVFSGGRAKRDYKTLIGAVKDLDVKLKIVTRDRDCVDWEGELPENVELEFFKPLDQFLQDIKNSRFVVIPLFRGEEWSHGQTTIVQAMKLGKAVISNSNASVDDYITHNENGVLVEPEDVSALRAAIKELFADSGKVGLLEKNTLSASEKYTDRHFAEKLQQECLSVINQE
ncbi:MAG: glycosyltransferase [Planctomycetota bacterium]|jgi:glycosyltransferase involved in cell wall biosynthesis